MWENDNFMKEVEKKHSELSHLVSKESLTWSEYSLFLKVSFPIVKY